MPGPTGVAKGCATESKSCGSGENLSLKHNAQVGTPAYQTMDAAELGIQDADPKPATPSGKATTSIGCPSQTAAIRTVVGYVDWGVVY
jgi:hypothetical protein